MEKQGAEKLTEEQAKSIESIMSDRRVCMDIAEKSCRKLRKGCIPWSPKLARARDQVRVWTLLLKQKKGRKIKRKLIARLMKKTGTEIKERAVDDIKESLDRAWLDYKNLVKNADDHRLSHLDSLAEARSLCYPCPEFSLKWDEFLCGLGANASLSR